MKCSIRFLAVLLLGLLLAPSFAEDEVEVKVYADGSTESSTSFVESAESDDDDHGKQYTLDRNSFKDFEEPVEKNPEDKKSHEDIKEKLRVLGKVSRLAGVHMEDLEELADALAEAGYVVNRTRDLRLEEIREKEEQRRGVILGALWAAIKGLVVCGTLFIAATMILLHQAWKSETPVQGLSLYSVEVPNSAVKGYGPIRRNVQSPDKLIDCPEKGVETLYQAFQIGLNSSRHLPCLGKRGAGVNGRAGDYVWKTYEETNQCVTNFGSGMMELEMIPRVDNMRMLAFYLKNCIEWVVAEQACFAYSATTVPLYDTLGPESVAYVINQTQLRTVLCSEAEIDNLLSVAGQCKTFRYIVQVGKISDETRRKVEAKGLRVFSFEEVEEAGKAKPLPHKPPRKEDIATFCYTSGTTGDPKGVLLTHTNMVCNFTALAYSGIQITAEDVHLSYLPLAHVFERAILGIGLYKGARVGFYQGDTRKIMEDLKALRPTVFPSVPRLLNRVYDKVMARVSDDSLKSKLFHFALRAKEKNLKLGYLKHPIWDKIVFGKVAKTAGLDRCKVIISGSAPLSAEVMQFLRCVLGCKVMEGYGQTETAAAATITHPDDYTLGHVGAPQVANEIRLMDVPEMGYLSTDLVHGDANIPCRGRGEICFRGHNIFKGYYKMEKKTKETMDAEGFCHSGDIGIWLPDGKVKIVDRLKNIFKLSQGEYVAAEKIENVYNQSPFIAQSFVYGDSTQPFLVGIFVPDEEYLEDWKKNHSDLQSKSFAELCEDQTVRDEVKKSIDTLGKERGLHGFEKVKAFHLSSEPFSQDNNTMTPTFKLKRNEAKLLYKKELSELYVSAGGQKLQG